MRGDHLSTASPADPDDAPLASSLQSHGSDKWERWSDELSWVSVECLGLDAREEEEP